MPTRTSPEPAFDRFTLPGAIPDDPTRNTADRGDESPRPLAGGAGGGRGRATGEAHPLTPSREREGEHPAGTAAPPFPFAMPGDPPAAVGHGQVFTRERRVRFLDHLAFMGNVRAAAARVGVSHETAYRARRQDAAFAALWDAALVHARSYGESQLATRALDGVEVPIVYHGEVTYVVRHDPRLLLAHLGRLDRRVADDAAALARAGRFDELLAGYAGHEAPAGFAAAAAEALDWRERATAPALPPTREAWVAWRRGEAIAGPGRGNSAKAEARAMAAAGEAAGTAWDRWHGDALARVAAIVRAGEAGGGDAAGESAAEAPVEFKSATGPWNFAAPDRVTPVNPGRGGRARRLQLRCGAAVAAPYSAPLIA